MFSCGYNCGFKSSNNQCRIRHEEAAHEGVVTRCPICDTTVKYSGYLSEHIKLMHGTETFPCGECSYVGKTKERLKRHKKNRHEEKLYKCEFCDYKAAIPSLLNEHFHYKSFFKHECDKCGMKFKHNPELERHQKRLCYKYRCENCRFKTNEKKHFEKHLQSNRCEKTSYIYCKVCHFIQIRLKTWKGKYYCDIQTSALLLPRYVGREGQ